MEQRNTVSHFFITVVVLFFMVLLGMVLKARYRQSSLVTAASVPKAIPVAAAANVPSIPEVRAYNTGDFWVLPHPQLVVSRGNEPDKLRIRSGSKEDVFALYFIEAVEVSWSHPQRAGKQAASFGNAPVEKVQEVGRAALDYVTQLLRTHKFTVATRWANVPESERFFAFITVETAPGKQEDLGELLVSKGYAMPGGEVTNALPMPNRTVDAHLKILRTAVEQAKKERAGLWAHATK